MSVSTPKAAIAVVDMQEDFCEPNGSLAIQGARELAPVINCLLSMPVFDYKFATQDWHPVDHVSFASQHDGYIPRQTKHTIRNPENDEEVQITTTFADHCVQGTPGSDIIPEIDQDKFAHVVRKGWDSRLESFSGFGPPFRDPSVAMTELRGLLTEREITHLFVVGVGFDGCVKNTALDGQEFGYKTYVIQDGVNSAVWSDEIRVSTLSDLQKAGVELVGLGLSVGELARSDKARNDAEAKLRGLLQS